MNKFMSWYQALEAREQQLVSIGGVFLIIFIFYGAVWSPLNGSIDSKQQALDKQLQQNSWATQAIADIKSSSSVRRVSGGGSLTQIVNNSSRRFNIQIARMQPKGDQLQIWIDSVSFNELMNWLGHLETAQKLQLKGMDISQTEDAGIVRVRNLQLEKG